MSCSTGMHRGNIAEGTRPWLALAAAALLLLALSAPAAARQPAGQGYRLGLLEANSHWIHKRVIEAYKKGLVHRGLGDLVHFIPGAVYRPNDLRTEGDVQRAARDLMARSDLDLIIAVGEDAALALLYNNNEHTPVLVVAVPDAVSTELMTNERQTAAENFAIRVQPDRWLNMFRLFQAVAPFRRLGVLCPGDRLEQKMIHLDQVQEVARQQGFRLLLVTCASHSLDQKQCLEGLKALKRLGMDACYLGALQCFDAQKGDPSPLLDYLTANKVASFAPGSVEQVERGALVGFSALDFVPTGRVLAEMTARILRGETPAGLISLEMDHPKVAINFQTAAALGIDLPPDILIAADRIYLKTIRPKPKHP